MNSRQLVKDTLAGRPTPRTPCGPLAVHNTAVLAGVSIEDYTLKPDVMVDCIARYYERFEPDAVWVSADTWITAEAMGAEVAFPGDNQPMAGTGKHLVESAADFNRIIACDPSTRGRQPLMLEAVAKLRERLGDEVFIVGCFDQCPFSIACSLAGMNEIMLKVMTDQPFVEALVEKCIEYSAAYANALGHAGADMVSTGDSPAGLTGAEPYREFALPAEQRVFDAIQNDSGVTSSLHICGRTTHLLADMATAGADVLELDYMTPLEEACRIVPDTIAIWGNLDPVGVLVQGSPADVTAAANEVLDTVRRHGRTRFVLSSGCTLAPETPVENLEALFAVTKASTCLND